MGIGHARRNRFLARIFVLGAGALIATALAPCSGAAACQEKVLYSFCVQGYPCTDGFDPAARLIGVRHDLYGRQWLRRHGVRADPQRSQDRVDGNGAVQLLRAGQYVHEWIGPL